MELKPIIFNGRVATKMVRALLENNKTVTRQPVKPQPKGYTYPMPMSSSWPNYYGCTETSEVFRPPYHPGDILYVRETWNYLPLKEARKYLYKADGYSSEGKYKWKSSTCMPREAARIFLRVTNVSMERLQKITEESAIKEGFKPVLCDRPVGCLCTDSINKEYLKPALLGFVEAWNTTLKSDDRARYGWSANPWVWIIEFERISKEEVSKTNESKTNERD